MAWYSFVASQRHWTTGFVFYFAPFSEQMMGLIEVKANNIQRYVHLIIGVHRMANNHFCFLIYAVDRDWWWMKRGCKRERERAVERRILFLSRPLYLCCLTLNFNLNASEGKKSFWLSVHMDKCTLLYPTILLKYLGKRSAEVDEASKYEK